MGGCKVESSSALDQQAPVPLELEWEPRRSKVASLSTGASCLTSCILFSQCQCSMGALGLESEQPPAFQFTQVHAAAKGMNGKLQAVMNTAWAYPIMTVQSQAVYSSGKDTLSLSRD